MQDNKKDRTYDVAIIGGGPAGLTAAIYTARYGLKTIIISKDIGGMANLSHEIENYPGYKGSGFELMQKFYKQATEFGSKFMQKQVIRIEKKNKEFIISTGIEGKDKILAKATIICSGTEKRKLGIPGEAKFLGKGISYCATCDAHFFKNKTAAVIGGGNSAAEASLILSNLAKKVYLIYRKDKLRADSSTIRKINEKKNIEVLFNETPKEASGENFVKKLALISGKEIKVDGIFIEIGNVPKTEMFDNLNLKRDSAGFIEVDHDMKTNVAGVFAAGDVINSKLKQAVVSAGQGAIAARSAFDYIEE